MFPERGTVFDFFFQKVGSTWAAWEDMIDKSTTIPQGAKVQWRLPWENSGIWDLQYSKYIFALKLAVQQYQYLRQIIIKKFAFSNFVPLG